MGPQGMPPGFRFSPTDEELVVHYLKNRACGKDFHQGVIAEVDIYKHEPWDLPEKSALPSHDPVWYFFNAQDKRHSHTARVNRTTSKGYWKATGKDRKICCGPHTVGIKKTLIYYEGRAPSGKRTDWIMHEYKLDEEFEKRSKVVCAAALCRIRKKGGPGPRNGEQYGAPVFHENEWGEDVEDDVDEKPPVPSESRAFSIPNQCKDLSVQAEKVWLDVCTEDCGSNDISRAEGLDITEQDLCAFLESFLSNDKEATSLEPEMASSVPVLDRTYIDNHHFDCDTTSDLYALRDIESLFDLDGKSMHDILHPTSGEEQILGELLHLADCGQCHTESGDCSMRILSPPPVHNGGILYGDDVGPSGVAGGFIELDDMNSPLDGFVMRLPQEGSFYNVHGEEQQPSALFDGVEPFARASDLLHTQGSATRRARLKIVPPSGAHVNTPQQNESVHNSHPQVQRREVSSDTNLQIVSGTFKENGQKFNSTSGSGSDLDEIANMVKFSPESFMFKQTSYYTIAKCEEMLPQTVFTATTESQDEESLALKNIASSTVFINQSKIQRATLEGCISPVDPLSSGPPCLLNTSSLTQDVALECEAGLDPTNGSMSKHVNSSCCVHEPLDCEAGLDPLVVRCAKAEDPNATSLHGNSVIGQLVSKVQSLTLGSQMVQLESSLGTTFNDKVFALGKPVAQLLPSKVYVNPYHSLRRGAMASLSRLALSILLLLFLFLGIHMITKKLLENERALYHEPRL